MEVTVQLHTVLQRQVVDGWQRELRATIIPESTVADLVAALEIDVPLESLILVVNGRTANPEQQLAAGDTVSLIPAISGGAPKRTQRPKGA